MAKRSAAARGRCPALWLHFLLASAGSAQAAFPGANGKLAFAENGPPPDYDVEVFTMNLDGSGLANVSNYPSEDDLEPAWSPNGRRLAISRGLELDVCPPSVRTCRIWLMDADGSNQTQLLTTGSDVSAPAWSPDGQELAFAAWSPIPTSEGCCYAGDLGVANADGTNVRSLIGSTGSEDSPSWSPDRQKIAFHSYTWWCDDGTCAFKQADIWVVNQDGSGVVNLTDTPAPCAPILFCRGPSETDPDWSPEGEKIAYGLDGDIWVMDPDGTDKVNVTSTAGTSEFDPAWSPDGTKIAFGSAAGLSIMSPDRSDREVIGTGGNPSGQPLGALDPYPRPGGGTPLQVPLVPEFAQCTSAAQNANHVAPLALDSCSPPALASSVLTTSTIGRGTGLVRLDVQPGNTGTPEDEADVAVSASVGDVRCGTQATPGCAAADADYTGRLLLSTTIRLTDRANGFGGVSATSEDTSFEAPLDCVATPASPSGSTCSVQTSADSMLPGLAVEGKRAVFSTFSFLVEDAGPNGSGYEAGCPPACGDGDEAVFLRQGVFAP
jgi:Tol biopolymer transport system component